MEHTNIMSFLNDKMWTEVELRALKYNDLKLIGKTYDLKCHKVKVSTYKLYNTNWIGQYFVDSYASLYII